MNFKPLVRLSKNAQTMNFMKNRPVWAEFKADGKTDMTKVIDAFRISSNAPKNTSVC